MPETYIQRVLDGDTEAFRYIIQECKDRAYSLALSVVKEEFLAQDVVQEAFLKAYQNLAGFRSDSSFSTWFYRIVYNEALKVVKSEKRLDWQNSESEPVRPMTGNHDPVSLLNEEHHQYWIQEALRKLSPRKSLALRLFYLEEQSIEQITRITGWSSANTKVLLHRAREELKILLTDIYINGNEELPR